MRNHSLYKLTAKLNEKEISFINTFIKDHTKNKSKEAYLELFNMPIANKFTNDEDILKNLKNAYLQNHYSAARHYLYNLVLKALRLYYATYKEGDPKVPFLNHTDKLRTVFILINKELFEEAYKLTNKYIKEWKQKEDYSNLAIAYKFLDRIELLSGKKLENFENMSLAAKYALKQAVKYKYDYLAKEITLKLNKIGIARTKEERFIFSTYLNSEDFKTDLPDEKYYWNAKSKCHIALLEFEEAYYCYEQLLSLTKKQLGANPNTNNVIINIWWGLMNCALGKRNFDDFNSCRDKYLKAIAEGESLPTSNQKIFSLMYNSCMLKYYDLTSDKASIFDLSVVFKNSEDTVNHKVYDNLLIESYFIIGKNCAKAGKFEAAIDWIQTAINRKDSFDGTYIINFCFIYLWLIRYKINDFDLLQPITNTAYRYMRKNKTVYPLEKNFLSFFRSLQINPTNTNLKKQKNKLIKNNALLVENKPDKYLLNYLNGEDFIKNL